MIDIKTINIQIKSYSDGWILSKFAEKLQKNITDNFGISTHINGINKYYDVTHHIPYYDAFKAESKINTFLITHIDTAEKENKIKNLLDYLDSGICLSKDTALKLKKKLNKKNIISIIPGIDKFDTKKITIGFASNVYEDNRKKINLILQQILKLDNSKIRVSIIGSGWESFTSELRRHAFEVVLLPYFDYSYYHKIFWPSLDYFVYGSEDEGSMAFLDACAYSVKTIVTYQGFHKDLKRGITHKIRNIQELSRILAKIVSKEFTPSRVVANLTWDSYAAQHVQHWSTLINPKVRLTSKRFLHLSQNDT